MQSASGAIELTRVHLALADLAGARTLMREIDEVLKRRPGLGTLVGEAQALRARLSRQRGAGSAGASALTAAELRVDGYQRLARATAPLCGSAR